jgi:hypothetical protein
VSSALRQAFALVLAFTGEVFMSLVLPGKIPVAADSLRSLSRIGSPRVLRTKATALVLITEDASDPYSVWASPKLTQLQPPVS